jgi:hypothetical protein
MEDVAPTVAEVPVVAKDKEEAIVVEEETFDGDLELRERGGDDPRDGTGEALLDTGIPNMPFDIADMSKTYGPSQRGATAPKKIQAGKLIFHEVADMWVATAAPPLSEKPSLWEKQVGEDYKRFFLGTQKTKVPPYHVCPPELSYPTFPQGGLHVALAGLLIQQTPEDVADIIIGDSRFALHGSLDLLNFPAPQDCYEIAKRLYFADKADKWDVKRFGRLFGVLQVNALRGMMPFSDACYGVGLFSGAAFFNHACQPNAVMIVNPNNVYIQALTDIDVGDEITVAYQELPLEMLAPAMVRVLHMRTGAIVNELGCRCETCRIHLEDEAEALKAAGCDPNAAREVDLDVSAMFLPATAERLKLDERLRTYVMALFNDPKGEGGMRASHWLRVYYEHFLAPPPPRQPSIEDDKKEEEGATPSSFCPDLAYVAADIYCRCIIHFPGQDVDNYLFWTSLYNDLLLHTAINMPKTVTDALGARCYAALLICATVDRADEERQRFIFNTFFLEAWLLLRAAHKRSYGHHAYLTLTCAAYPNIGHVVGANHQLIANKEAQATIRRAMREAEQQQQEAEAKIRAAGMIPVPRSEVEADMMVPATTMEHLAAFNAMLEAEGIPPVDEVPADPFPMATATATEVDQPPTTTTTIATSTAEEFTKVGTVDGDWITYTNTPTEMATIYDPATDPCREMSVEDFVKNTTTSTTTTTPSANVEDGAAPDP